MEKPQTRLGKAFADLADALEELADALDKLSASLGRPIYRRFDSPFGPSDEARKIWIRYRQYTTRN